jgi:hypothetical protein
VTETSLHGYAEIMTSTILLSLGDQWASARDHPRSPGTELTATANPNDTIVWFILLGLGLSPVMVGATEVIVGNARVAGERAHAGGGAHVGG